LRSDNRLGDRALDRLGVLRDDLAAILRFAANKKNPAVLLEAGLLGALLSQESLVAGTGFEPVTFRL
jgi:site-specific DNA recombinase